MIKSCRRAIRATALVSVFSLLHVYAGVSLAAIMPQDVTGKLLTRGDQAVTVNGNPATSGATILTGSTIATGDQVGATINLGTLGSLDIAPNTRLQVEFSRGQIKITLVQGCLILRVKQGNYGEIDTDKGKAASNDPNQKQVAVLDVCYPPGAPSPIVNQGAAANAGAGVPGTIGGGAGGTGGLNRALLATLLGGGGGAVIIALILANRGETVSESS